MKIGFQTIVWWPFREPIEYRLQVIAEAGYQGVELKERPDELPPIEELLEILNQFNLGLIGLAGGSLKSRMEYCKDFRPEYLYTDDWNEEIAQLMKKSGESKAGPFTLAIHPHVFRPEHRLKTAHELLNENPNLKFVPDTAHLMIVGDDPIEAIQLFKGRKDRIAAVHLKDWSQEFGRSAHRYARGFIEPDEGVVDLYGVLKALEGIDYSGWLIAEQDSTKTYPELNTLVWARWLALKGLLPEPPTMPAKRTSRQRLKQIRTPAEAHFLDTVVTAAWQDIETCYESIARAFLEFCDCELVTLWTCSPAYRLMNLVAVTPDINASLPHVIYYRNTLSGDTIAEQTIQHFHLTDPAIVKRFNWSEILKERKFRWMVSVPVFNPWNPHHVRLVVNIFHSKEHLTVSNDELGALAVAVGYSTCSVLDETCLTSSAKVDMLVGKKTSLEDFSKGLTQLVAKIIDCEEVAILLTNLTGNELELLGCMGEEWMSRGVEEWYRTWEDSISRVWDTKETLIMARGDRRVEEKEKEEMNAEERGACSATPFVSADGTVLGLIYCCSKRTPRKLGISESFAFSDDDCVVLEAIVQAAIPHIEVLMERKRREKILGRLTHELKVPLVAIRGAVDFIKRTEGIDKTFDYDYPGDIESWCELMGRLIDNADAFRYSSEGMQIEPTRTNLLRDVIAPSIRQVRLLLRERGFSPMSIYYTKGKFQRFPRLWLDRNQFQQVIFNLLSNAIKYADNDPNAFRVEIDGEIHQETEFVVGSAFLIWFRDWGPGIEEEMEETIFEEGIRGENAIMMDVAGQGLGLWVVRQIVERHGGEIKLTNLKSPTEFRISIPYSLKLQAPL